MGNEIEENIACVVLKNNRTCIRLSVGGWVVEDAGQCSLSGGIWKNRKEAYSRGERVVADVFPTLREALTAALAERPYAC